MKRKIVLFTALAGIFSLTLSSYHDGMIGATIRGVTSLPVALPGIKTANQQNSAVSNCNGDFIGGSGCHGAADANLAVNTQIFYNYPANTALVTSNGFVPGHKYGIRLTGSYTGTNSDTKFGFQMTITGWKNSSLVTLLAPGTVSLSESAPTGIRDTIVQGAHLIEQMNTLTRTITGSSNPKSYQVDITWTAPDSTFDSVMIRNAVCGVDGDGTENGDAQNAGASITLHRTLVGVTEVFNNASFKVFPNPAVNDINLQINNLGNGAYEMSAIDMNGKRIMNRTINISSTSHTETINTASWPAGAYFVQIVKDGQFKNISIVKQ